MDGAGVARGSAREFRTTFLECVLGLYWESELLFLGGGIESHLYASFKESVDFQRNPGRFNFGR